MVVALLSDIHSNIDALEAVCEDLEKQRIRKIAILGDIVGYGPETLKVLQKVRQMESEGAVILPGNHDISYVKKVDGIKAGMLGSDIKMGMSNRASKALDRQIELMLKNPRTFFSEDYQTELYRDLREYSPKFFDEIHKGLQGQRKKDLRFWHYLLPGFFAARRVKKGDKSFSKNEAVGIWMSEHPKMVDLNKEVSRQIMEREEAINAYAFLEKIRKYDPHMVFDGVHCFHSTTWDQNKPYGYLLDSRQIEMHKENNMAIPPSSSLSKARDFAKSIYRREVFMALGHLHLPSIYTEEQDGVKLTVANSGTVGMPRLRSFKGMDFYDKATYLIKDGSDFKVRLVPYDWQKVHEDMKEKMIPANPLWAQINGEV